MLIIVKIEGQVVSKSGVMFNFILNKKYSKSSFFTKVMKNKLFGLPWGKILKPESLRGI